MPGFLPDIASLMRRGSSLLPTPAKLYLESLTGNQAPITEKDFSEEELKAIQQLIGTSTGSGGIGYGNYDPHPLEQPGLAGLATPKGRIANSLGQFNYQQGPEGAEVSDTYDFNPTYTQDSPAMQALTAVGTAGFSPLHMLGEYLLPPGKGRPVKIKLPRT